MVWAIMPLLHLHRHDQKKEFAFLEGVDFSVVRDPMYKPSEKANVRCLS